MIDTLNIAVWKCSTNVKPFDVAKYIRVAKTGVIARNGKPYAQGEIGNYRVYIDNKSVRLSGSIAKLVQGGENVSSPSRAVVAEGVQWLSDTLHLNIGAAAVSRVDVASTFALPIEPAAYIGELSSRAEMERTEYDTSTLYFASPSRTLCFYDKRAEVSQSGQSMPQAWADRSCLLRYEMRLMSSIAQQVGMKTMKVQDVVNPETWARLVNLWAQEYRQVVKTRAESISAATTQRQAFNAIFADLLRYAPGGYLSDVLRLTTGMTKGERYRLKKALREIERARNTELINQLDDAVEAARAEAVSV